MEKFLTKYYRTWYKGYQKNLFSKKKKVQKAPYVVCNIIKLNKGNKKNTARTSFLSFLAP